MFNYSFFQSVQASGNIIVQSVLFLYGFINFKLEKSYMKWFSLFLHCPNLNFS